MSKGRFQRSWDVCSVSFLLWRILTGWCQWRLFPVRLVWGRLNGITFRVTARVIGASSSELRTASDRIFNFMFRSSSPSSGSSTFPTILYINAIQKVGSTILFFTPNLPAPPPPEATRVESSCHSNAYTGNPTSSFTNFILGDMVRKLEEVSATDLRHQGLSIISPAWMPTQPSTVVLSDLTPTDEFWTARIIFTHLFMSSNSSNLLNKTKTSHRLIASHLLKRKRKKKK